LSEERGAHRVFGLHLSFCRQLTVLAEIAKDSLEHIGVSSHPEVLGHFVGLPFISEHLLRYLVLLRPASEDGRLSHHWVLEAIPRARLVHLHNKRVLLEVTMEVGEPFEILR